MRRFFAIFLCILLLSAVSTYFVARKGGLETENQVPAEDNGRIPSLMSRIQRMFSTLQGKRILYAKAFPISSAPPPSFMNERTSSAGWKLEAISLEYPWKVYSGDLSPITKDYFRCKGSPLHPPIPKIENGKVVMNTFDCGGTDSHSLPMRNGKEFIYPILIELMNHIQRTTGKPVIITSGHRCPVHNRYVDPSIRNQFSKHLIGAEVAFYVKGLETQPQVIVSCLEDFYATHPRYASERKDHVPFVRYDKKTDASTKPWMNKEVFLKLYLPHEGRNGDTHHPYSYFSLQVRFDRERHLKVTVSPQEAEHYLRY